MKQFDRFIPERRYLTNVSPRTLEWYEQSLAWLGTENPTGAELKNCVIRMREAGLKATSKNNRIRAINAYLHWLTGGATKCHPACPHLRIARLKEPSMVLPTSRGI